MSTSTNTSTSAYKKMQAEAEAFYARRPRVSRASCEAGVLTFEFYGDLVCPGATITVPGRSLKALAEATDEQLAVIFLTSDGSAIHWPELDVQMDSGSMVQVIFGLPSHADAGRLGGTSKSETKLAAVRANGAKGGRPRKVAA